MDKRYCTSCKQDSMIDRHHMYVELWSCTKCDGYEIYPRSKEEKEESMREAQLV